MGKIKKLNSIKRKAVFLMAITAIFFYFTAVLCPINPAAGETVQANTVKSEEAASGEEKESTEGSDLREEAEDDMGFTEYTADDFGPQAQDESYGWTVFKLLFILGLMGAGFFYFFRFVSRQTGIRTLGRDVVNVLSVVPIGQNKYLQVIDLDGRVLVLGVTDSNINLITEVTSKNEIDRLRLLSSKSSEFDKPGFQDQVVGFVSGMINKIGDKGKSGARTVNPDPQQYSEDYLYYLKSQKNRLKKMNGQKDD